MDFVCSWLSRYNLHSATNSTPEKQPRHAYQSQGVAGAIRRFWIWTNEKAIFGLDLIYHTVVYYIASKENCVAHTTKDKDKLLSRVRRIRGQVEAIERAIDQEHECSGVLQLMAACRGALNPLPRAGSRKRQERCAGGSGRRAD
jgi:DNA-binding FrmR family transcriptional regulator